MRGQGAKRLLGVAGLTALAVGVASTGAFASASAGAATRGPSESTWSIQESLPAGSASELTWAEQAELTQIEQDLETTPVGATQPTVVIVGSGNTTPWPIRIVGASY